MFVLCLLLLFDRFRLLLFCCCFSGVCSGSSSSELRERSEICSVRSMVSSGGGLI